MKTQSWFIELKVTLEDGATPHSLVEALVDNLYPELGEELVDYHFTEVEE